MADSAQTRVLIPYFPQSGPWECCTCSNDYPEADVPWTTASKNLICEACIRRQFEQALDFDAHYPARWGPDELDPSHYKLILGPDFIARYVRKGQEIEEANKPGIPEGMVRGKDCQLCPGCQKPISLRDGCNHIVCLCGTQFCFICGEEADHHSDHWMEGGCPRWNTVESGQAMHDGADVADGEEHDIVLEVIRMRSTHSQRFG